MELLKNVLVENLKSSNQEKGSMHLCETSPDVRVFQYWLRWQTGTSTHSDKFLLWWWEADDGSQTQRVKPHWFCVDWGVFKVTKTTIKQKNLLSVFMHFTSKWNSRQESLSPGSVTPHTRWRRHLCKHSGWKYLFLWWLCLYFLYLLYVPFLLSIPV